MITTEYMFLIATSMLVFMIGKAIIKKQFDYKSFCIKPYSTKEVTSEDHG